MNNLPSFHETTFTEITGADGSPWVASPDLARALGYADGSAVNRIYKRNADEFTPSMTGLQRLSLGLLDRESQGETRIFSLRGAHLIAMFAKTARAAEFRRWVLDLLEGSTLRRVGSMTMRGAPPLGYDPEARLARYGIPEPGHDRSDFLLAMVKACIEGSDRITPGRIIEQARLGRSSRTWERVELILYSRGWTPSVEPDPVDGGWIEVFHRPEAERWS